MKSELIMAVNQICTEKDLPRDVILEAVEAALVSAYRRNYGNNAAVQVKIDPDNGELRVYCEKQVVEVVRDPNTEVSLAEAGRYDPQVSVGGTVLIEQAPTEVGRIAAQTAKQVILQRIHEAERDALYDYFHQREGELITGTVQSIDYRTNQVTINLGKKVEGILTPEDQLPNERYRIGQNVRCYVAEVHKGTRGPTIRLSRTHRNMLRRLLEREVPEIYNGTVEIKSIAREPGQRSKVAVTAKQAGVDAVGSCVGMRGTRIQNIVDELGGEKIDVVEWSADARQFINNALSPAKPTDCLLIEEGENRTAIVVVPDKQLSLAIGKEGQNARLAAKLTGWRIDIKSESEAAAEGLSEIRRQQLQMLKTRSLESKVAAAPSDDLLSRAEWLLREKDRSAMTLEQAARLLAGAEPTGQAPTAPAPEVPTPEAPAVVEGEVATTEPAQIETPMVEVEAEYLTPAFEGEGEVGQAETKPRPKGKKARKQRALVYDEQLGEVVAVKKRKRSQADWDEFEDY